MFFVSSACRHFFYTTYFLLSILVGSSLSCGGGGGDSGGQTPIQGGSGDSQLGPLPGDEPQLTPGDEPQPIDPPLDRTDIQNIIPPVNPTSPSPFYNNPFDGEVLSDWLSLLQDSRWKNNC
ncbi:MAG: hypothetical protein HYW85_06785, partial [Deltaproteobacteria bacterium]|nr:hypothetical protein [Deltaproteobacteria bacterium]